MRCPVCGAHSLGSGSTGNPIMEWRCFNGHRWESAECYRVTGSGDDTSSDCIRYSEEWRIYHYE